MKTHVQLNLKDIPGRMFVVGDLHGAFDPLVEALKRVGYDRHRDHLFSVGDLVDRGPKNFELLKLFDEEPSFHAVRGNHEEMILEREQAMHVANGGAWYYHLSLIEQDHVDGIIEDMPLLMTVISPSGRKIGIVHADVQGNDWDEFVGACQQDFPQSQGVAQWSRAGIERAKRAMPMIIQNVDMVYMGHTPQGAPVRSGNQCWIDTCAYRTGQVYLEEVL